MRQRWKRSVSSGHRSRTKYEYDDANRLSIDRVTTASTGGDDYVRSIATTYDERGRRLKLTSWSADDGTGTCRNEVQSKSDLWGNVIKEYQAHAGEVNDEDEGGDDSPWVGYTHAEIDATYQPAALLLIKNVRKTQTRYPNGRVVYYSYYNDSDLTDGQDAINDPLNRVRSIASAATATDGTPLAASAQHAAFTYLGEGRIVKESHPDVTGGLNLTYGTGGTYGGGVVPSEAGVQLR